MRVLIVGDPYFLSYEVGKLLAELGHELMFYDISIRAGRGLEDIGKVVIASPDNDYSMRTTFSSFKPEAVFWMSGMNLDHLNNYNPIDDYKQFINSIMVLCDVISIYKVNHILFRSSYEVYGGIKTRRRKLSELDVCNPLSHRGAALKAAEDILRIHCYSNDVKLTVLRLFEVYGNEPAVAPFGLAQAVIKSFVEGLSVGVPGAGSSKDFISVFDAARLVVFSFSEHIFGPINIGSGDAIKVSKLLSAANKAVGNTGRVIDITDTKWPNIPAVANVDRITSKLKCPYTSTGSLLTDIPEMVDFYRERINVR